MARSLQNALAGSVTTDIPLEVFEASYHMNEASRLLEVSQQSKDDRKTHMEDMRALDTYVTTHLDPALTQAKAQVTGDASVKVQKQVQGLIVLRSGLSYSLANVDAAKAICDPLALRRV